MTRWRSGWAALRQEYEWPFARLLHVRPWEWEHLTLAQVLSGIAFVDEVVKRQGLGAEPLS